MYRNRRLFNSIHFNRIIGMCKEFFWRVHFAGRMMEVTRCDFQTAWRRAHEAGYIDADWINKSPRDIADQRARLYKK